MVALILYNYYRRRRPYDLLHTLSGYVSPLWIRVLKASTTAFVSDIKIKVGDGCSTRFWLDHWVGDATLASIFPDLFLLAMDSSATVNTQTCLFEGRMIWTPQSRRWSYQHLSNNINNLLALLRR